MNASLKNTLQVLIVIILLGIVGYLGYRVFSFRDNPGSAPLPVNQGTPSESSPSTSESNGSEVTDSSSVQATNCNADDQCTVISEKKRSLAGKETSEILCVNKSYLETCSTCKTSDDLVAESAKEATCTCLNNYCEFELLNSQ